MCAYRHHKSRILIGQHSPHPIVLQPFVGGCWGLRRGDNLDGDHRPGRVVSATIEFLSCVFVLTIGVEGAIDPVAGLRRQGRSHTLERGVVADGQVLCGRGGEDLGKDGQDEDGFGGGHCAHEEERDENARFKSHKM